MRRSNENRSLGQAFKHDEPFGESIFHSLAPLKPPALPSDDRDAPANPNRDETWLAASSSVSTVMVNVGRFFHWAVPLLQSAQLLCARSESLVSERHLRAA